MEIKHICLWMTLVIAENEKVQQKLSSKFASDGS